jgi:hypothetical protein
MADFKEMYYTLFRAQVKAKAILEEAEKKTEAMFIDSKDPIEFIGLGGKSRIAESGETP